MFYKVVVNDYVRVAPALLGLDIKDAIVKQVKKKYDGFISKDLGIDLAKMASEKQSGKGKKIEEMPSSLNDNSYVQPFYEKFKGWTDDISLCKKYQELPKNCRTYLEYIEKILKAPIKYISVGPERRAIIKK